MYKLLKSNKGIALAAVMMIFTVVAIIGGVVTTISLSEINFSVHSEKSTAAYYLARSAVDIVSTQINEEFKILKSKEKDTYETEEELKEYTDALATFQNLLGVFVSPYESSVTVNIDGKVFPVTIKKATGTGGKEYIEVSCTAEYDGVKSSAATKVGSFTISNDNTKVGQEFFAGNDVIYAWNEISIKNNFKLKSDKANVSAGKKIGIDKIDKDSKEVIQTIIERPVPIIQPDSEDVNRIKETSFLNGVKKSGKYSVSVTSAHNGNYGSFTLANDVTWNVDTSSGDVILIFNSIISSNNRVLDVKITGANNLYIFIYEQSSPIQSRTLVDLGSGLNIDSPGDIPQAYFVVYNDSAQDWYKNTWPSIKKSDTDKPLMPYASTNTVFNPLDNVTIKNGSTFEAFLYMPGCDLSLQNQGEVIGAFYASNVTTMNGLEATFKVVPAIDGDLFYGYIEEDSKTIYYNKAIFDNIPVIWIRNPK